MKITNTVLIVGIATLAIGILVGISFSKPAKGGQSQNSLSGPQWAQRAALGLDKTISSFPDLRWDHFEHSGIFNPHAGWIVEWMRPDASLKESPANLLLALVVPTLPPIERESKEVCIWKNTVCYFPPKNIPVCLWGEQFPQNRYCFHPGMDEDNPEHPGIAHPPLLIITTNLKGPLKYPADFEKKYPGMNVFIRTEKQLKEIWR